MIKNDPAFNYHNTDNTVSKRTHDTRRNVQSSTTVFNRRTDINIRERKETKIVNFVQYIRQNIPWLLVVLFRPKVMTNVSKSSKTIKFVTNVVNLLSMCHEIVQRK